MRSSSSAAEVLFPRPDEVAGFLTAARAEIGVPFVVLVDRVRATPLPVGVEGAPARAELRDVVPGDAGVFGAGDILPDGPGTAGFFTFVAMVCCMFG
jgi:hypothetical protein